ncbi:molybdate transport system substrate-binding protein [Arenibacter nanhaiticus]|uniref:Molybdate transport system substrate-binding protein n=1 Tax=Arenibacter nanhaiticus TaxID=558155 RepID=A0A1M6HK97_9FLAO|nr:molybdate ABC transporter substrate-binding protein [Arenibacter nanhaiticus]SHJ22591.1 molybdate transport system substrate-binding protein [Arenibacter nanhaiticus]
MRLRILILGTLFFWLLFLGCSQKESDKLRIATAANMQFAMKAIVEKYTQKTGVDCELIIGSSGKLTSQIVGGAPYDIFLAANMKYPEAVYNSGLALNAPKVYASGKLVLWSMEPNIAVNITSLNSPEITNIALANPKTAPYGVAAAEVLQHYGLLEALSDKLVYGESIAQTNQFITSKAVQIGFTSLSAVLSPTVKDKGSWMALAPELYTPIHQGVVLVKQAKDPKKAQEFYNYLFSSEAKEILKEFGYLLYE